MHRTTALLTAALALSLFCGPAMAGTVDVHLNGLVTNQTLNSESDDYDWVDEGLVIGSTHSDNYNCIDPNLIIDADGVPWLAFGSFWSGIKMIRLDYETGKPSEEDDTLYSLARRPRPGAVEAPFIIRKEDFYYLFGRQRSVCSQARSDIEDAAFCPAGHECNSRDFFLMGDCEQIFGWLVIPQGIVGIRRDAEHVDPFCYEFHCCRGYLV